MKGRKFTDRKKTGEKEPESPKDTDRKEPLKLMSWKKRRRGNETDREEKRKGESEGERGSHREERDRLDERHGYI